MVVRSELDAGGVVDYAAPPAIDIDDAHENYTALLTAVMTSRNSDEDYKNLQSKLKDLETSDTQKIQLRYQLASYRDYTLANEIRTKSRWAWHEFFKSWDVLIMPVMTRPAFKHDHRPFQERTLQIDNQTRSYFDSLFWAGPSINNYLPSTVIPTGAVGEGLPIGIQIIGPEYGDLKTIECAKMLEAAGFRFVPPLGY